MVGLGEAGCSQWPTANTMQLHAPCTIASYANVGSSGLADMAGAEKSKQLYVLDVYLVYHPLWVQQRQQCQSLYCSSKTVGLTSKHLSSKCFYFHCLEVTQFPSLLNGVGRPFGRSSVGDNFSHPWRESEVRFCTCRDHSTTIICVRVRVCVRACVCVCASAECVHLLHVLLRRLFI